MFGEPTVWPNAVYIADLPSPDDTIWPTQADPGASNTIATCVPAMARDVLNEKRLPKLLQSIQAQKVKSMEVIIVVSDVLSITTNGQEWCTKQRQKLSVLHSALKIVCIGQRLTAGRARNVAARVASADILSYIDADDQEEPHRNQVIQSEFNCRGKELKMLLHSFYKRSRRHPYDQLKSLEDVSLCPDEQDGVEVIKGQQLIKLSDESHDQWVFHPLSRPGHPVVRREVFQHIHYTALAKGQDLAFCRDIIYGYGQNNNTVVFLNRPLTTYYQRSYSN